MSAHRWAAALVALGSLSCLDFVRGNPCFVSTDCLDNGRCVSGRCVAPGAPIAVSLVPDRATVLLGSTLQFAASVSGTSEQGVIWSYQPVNGGTLTEGLFKPLTSGQFQVSIRSKADVTAEFTAEITVPAVTISISPASITAFTGTTQRFSATVGNTVDGRVLWSVSTASVYYQLTDGVLTGAGVGTYQVVATSLVDSTASASAKVDIRSGPASASFLDQPPLTPVGHTLPPIRVQVLDDRGRPVSLPVAVSLALQPFDSREPLPPPLQGTKTVSTVQGVATFSDLQVAAPTGDVKLVARFEHPDFVFADTAYSQRFAILCPGGNGPFPIGGTVEGLTGKGLWLGSYDLRASVDAPGTQFQLDRLVVSAMPYSVQVLQQPIAPAQTCVVHNGTGFVGCGPVTDIAVMCH